MIDERTEQLINRKLDGELTESESLELNKLLIRSPESQALLEEYEQSDRLAADTLATVLPEQSESVAKAAEIQRWTGPRRGWWLRSRRGIAIAVAAMIAAMIGSLPNGRLGPATNPDRPHAASATFATGTVPFVPAIPTPVIEGPRQEDERVHRNVIAVYDKQTNCIYLLEVDQVRSTAVPVQRSY